MTRTYHQIIIMMAVVLLLTACNLQTSDLLNDIIATQESGNAAVSQAQLPTPTNTITPQPEGDAVVTGRYGVNVRPGPSTAFDPPITTLERGSSLSILGRTADNEWFQTCTADGRAGWVYAELVELNIALDGVPIADSPPTPQATATLEQVILVETDMPGAAATSTPTPPAEQPTARPQPTQPLPPPRETGLYLVSDRVRQIYQRGRALGNRSDRFSKVGDSLTASQAFLLGYGTGEYQLGEFDHLQAAVDHFEGSFNRDSLAAFVGFNAAAMLDSIWGDPDLCRPNETPMACEYRVHKPSIALIMLGSLDVQLYGVEQYRIYMEQIVQFTIDQGIIPVLTTFPNSGIYYQEKSVAFNQVLYDIANQQQIPLIDLRPVAQMMPDGGVAEDGYHLTQRHEQHNYINLAGEQNIYALTMRNYMTLEMLHSLLVGVPMG